MPDKGCTYTNGCLARCAYGAKVAYLGECTHKDAMRIVEDRGQGRPAQRDCKCDSKFEPVCAFSPLCTIPGEQTAALGSGEKGAGPASSGPAVPGLHGMPLLHVLGGRGLLAQAVVPCSWQAVSLCSECTSAEGRS